MNQISGEMMKEVGQLYGDVGHFQRQELHFYRYLVIIETLISAL